MGELRHVVAKRDRYLVPMPAVIRRHLGVEGRSAVWWTLTARGECVLSVHEVRHGGRPRVSAECGACGKVREELDRARAMLRTRTVADYNTAFGQGYERAYKDGPLWRVRLDAMADELHDLRGLIAQLVVRQGDRKPPRRRRGPARAAAVEHDPPYADDFDSHGHVRPRAAVEVVELPPPAADAG